MDLLKALLLFPLDILTTLHESYKVARERHAKRILASNRKSVAKQFNDLYTYRFRWDENQKDVLPGSAVWGCTPRGGYAWMCPECNKVHLASSCSAMSGLQYPACCSHREGHRLYANIRTK